MKVIFGNILNLRFGQALVASLIIVGCTSKGVKAVDREVASAQAAAGVERTYPKGSIRYKIWNVDETGSTLGLDFKPASETNPPLLGVIVKAFGVQDNIRVMKP